MGLKKKTSEPHDLVTEFHYQEGEGLVTVEYNNVPYSDGTETHIWTNQIVF